MVSPDGKKDTKVFGGRTNSNGRQIKHDSILICRAMRTLLQWIFGNQAIETYSIYIQKYYRC
jgi:hypothetical protein